MFFSSKEITQLIIAALKEDRLNHDALKGLLYYLNFPSEEIPIFIAETICNEDLISKQDELGKRLAFGHVNQLSDFRTQELRTNRQVRISRQLNRIALYLEEQKAPASIMNDFSNLCQSLYSGLIFFDARKNTNNNSFAAEEVLLLEQLVCSILSSQKLTLKFYELLFSKIGTSNAQMLAASLLKRLEESLENHSTSEEEIIDPNLTPAFSKNIENLEGFDKAVDQLVTFLEEKVGFKTGLH